VLSPNNFGYCCCSVRERSHDLNANFNRDILQSSTTLEMQMLMVICYKSGCSTNTKNANFDCNMLKKRFVLLI